jgi:hypothetical protein
VNTATKLNSSPRRSGSAVVFSTVHSTTSSFTARRCRRRASTLRGKRCGLDKRGLLVSTIALADAVPQAVGADQCAGFSASPLG